MATIRPGVYNVTIARDLDAPASCEGTIDISLPLGPSAANEVIISRNGTGWLARPASQDGGGDLEMSFDSMLESGSPILRGTIRGSLVDFFFIVTPRMRVALSGTESGTAAAFDAVGFSLGGYDLFVGEALGAIVFTTADGLTLTCTRAKISLSPNP